MSEERLYAITFDLEQRALDKYYNKSRRSAYRELGKFLKKNGYEHMEGSVYHSMVNQSNVSFFKMIDEMDKQLPWVKQCIKEMHRTVIPLDEIVNIKDVLVEKEKQKQKEPENPIKETLEGKQHNPIKVANQNIHIQSDNELSV